MGNINVVDQGPHLQGEYHGQESSVMKKLSLFFHLASLMVLNGLICNIFITIFLVYILSIIFFVKIVLRKVIQITPNRPLSMSIRMLDLVAFYKISSSS